MSSGALKLLARCRLRVLRRARQAGRPSTPPGVRLPRWVGLEPLEERLLYSIAPPGAELLTDQQSGQAEVVIDGPEVEATCEGQDQAAQWRPRRELVFVDTRVPDYQTLLGELLADPGDGRRVEVVVLDAEGDGVTQIAQTLSRYESLDAVHVISHGTDGGLQLGGSWLTAGNLAEQSGAIVGWGEALSANADLLLYGCDLAAGADGRTLVDQLARLTGADVAASADLTGGAHLGGDWDLEYHAGDIETALALDEMSGLRGVLGGVSVDVPAAQDTDEDTPLVFSAANGNAVTVTDGSGNDPKLRTTLSVTNGTLTLGSTAGVAIVGGGDGTATITIDGDESAINNALDGLRYDPTGDYSGPANLLVTASFSAGLQGHYDFENAGDPGNDGSPSGANDGTVNGATPAVDGTRGNVLSFDGNDFVQVSGMYGQPQSVTLAAWVQLDAGKSDGEVISLGDNVFLRVDDPFASKGVVAGFYNGSDWDLTTSGTYISGTGWHHVAYTFDDVANKQVIYIDGVALSTTSHADAISYSLGTDTRLGRHSVGSHFLHGDLDDARIYDRALSAQEILALAQETSSDTAGVAITVKELNDTAPTVVAGQSFGITEDAANGASVGTVLATDPDTVGALQAWAIVSGNDDGIFQINAATGEITIADNSNLDYESATSHVLGVRVGDGVNTSATESVTIDVTDVNDVMPTVTASQSFGITEDAANGASVGTVLATDPDTVGALQAWAIVSGNDDGIFQINAATGEITIADNSNLDYESATSHVLGVRVGDGVNTSATESVTIDVTDVNDVIPTVTASQSFGITEDAANGASVGTVLATDPDTVGALQAWAIVSGNDDGIFQINAATGEITIADNSNLDYESATSHVLGVRVGDGVNTSATESVTIDVTDVNDVMPTVTASQSFGITEDAANGASVGTVLATDPDTVGALQAWAIVSGNDDGIFQINAATGEITIADATNLDFDTTPSYALRVQVSDGVNASAIETVTVSVTTGPTGAIADVVVDEDAASTVIDLFAAFGDGEDADPDLLYSLIGNTNAGLFSTAIVDGAAGKLTLDYAPNQSGAATLTLRVRDTDGNFVDEAFVVTVDPENEDPVLAVNAGATVVQSGSVVITRAMLRVTDIDDSGAELIYTITALPGHGTLQLAGTTLAAGDTFTQDDIDAGRVAYLHDGTSVVDGFGFTVHDGAGAGIGGQRFDVMAAGPMLVPAPPGDPGAAIDAEADAEDSDVDEDESDEELSDAEIAALIEDGAAGAEASAATMQAAEEPARAGIVLFDQNGDQVARVGDQAERRSSDRPQVTAPIVDAAPGQQRLERAPAEVLDVVNGALARLSSVARPGALWSQLDQLSEQMTSAPRYELYAAGSATLVVTGLSAGYLVTLIRGGHLLASVLSSMPAWQIVDPLPILDSIGAGLEGAGEAGDGESLASMIDRSSSPADDH